MSTAEAAHAIADTFVAPSRALAIAADGRSWAPPLLVLTATALLASAVLAPRLDYERAVLDRLESTPQAAQLTAHDREVAVEGAHKIGTIGMVASALFLPAARALAVAFALFAAFRLAATPAPFPPTFAVASWALLPLGLRELLLLPAALRQAAIPAEGVPGLLPSSLAALAPPAAPARLVALLSAFDLFSLWSVALLALGMAHVARVRTGRAAATVIALWIAWVLVAHVALPGFAGAGARQGS